MQFGIYPASLSNSRPPVTLVGFNYVGLPDSYEEQSYEIFDPVEMNRLFEIGHGLGLSESAWQREPPGLHLPGAQH